MLIICVSTSCVFHRRRIYKKMAVLHFSHRWTLDRSTVHEPVHMADVVDPNADVRDKEDLQVESTPGVYCAYSLDMSYLCMHHLN